MGNFFSLWRNADRQNKTRTLSRRSSTLKRRRKPKKLRKKYRKKFESRADSPIWVDVPVDETGRDLLPPPKYDKFMRRLTPSISDHLELEMEIFANNKRQSMLSFWEPQETEITSTVLNDEVLLEEDVRQYQNDLRLSRSESMLSMMRRASTKRATRGRRKTCQLESETIIDIPINLYIQNYDRPILVYMDQKLTAGELIWHLIHEKRVEDLEETGCEWTLNAMTIRTDPHASMIVDEVEIMPEVSIFEFLQTEVLHGRCKVKFMLKQQHKQGEDDFEVDQVNKRFSMLQVQTAYRKRVSRQLLNIRTLRKRMSMVSLPRPMLIYRTLINLDSNVADFGDVSCLPVSISAETTVSNVVFDCLTQLSVKGLPKSQQLEGRWVMLVITENESIVECADNDLALDKMQGSGNCKFVLTLKHVNMFE